MSKLPSSSGTQHREQPLVNSETLLLSIAWACSVQGTSLCPPTGWQMTLLHLRSGFLSGKIPPCQAQFRKLCSSTMFDSNKACSLALGLHLLDLLSVPHNEFHYQVPSTQYYLPYRRASTNISKYHKTFNNTNKKVTFTAFISWK